MFLYNKLVAVQLLGKLFLILHKGKNHVSCTTATAPNPPDVFRKNGTCLVTPCLPNIQ